MLHTRRNKVVKLKKIIIILIVGVMKLRQIDKQNAYFRYNF